MRLRVLLLSFSFSELHHGDCMGVDALTHAIALAKRVTTSTRPALPVIHIHPPVNPAQRAFCGGDDVIIHPEKPYLERDRDVAAVDILIAVPHTAAELVRSGTWATVRIARSLRTVLIIRINPDGTIEFG